MKKDNYNANSIQIKEVEFDFNLIEIWANKYSKSIGFVKRGIEACRLAGIDPDYFLRKYLKNETGVVENKEVTEINKSLQNEAYR